MTCWPSAGWQTTASSPARATMASASATTANGRPMTAADGALYWCSLTANTWNWLRHKVEEYTGALLARADLASRLGAHTTAPGCDLGSHLRRRRIYATRTGGQERGGSWPERVWYSARHAQQLALSYRK